MSSLCHGCPLLGFRLVTSTGGSYTHSSISINAQNNIEIKTDTNVTEQFYIEGYFNDTSTSTGNKLNCYNLFKDNLKKFKLSVDVEAPIIEASNITNSTSNTTLTDNSTISANCSFEELSPSDSAPYVITFSSTND